MMDIREACKVDRRTTDRIFAVGSLYFPHLREMANAPA